MYRNVIVNSVVNLESVHAEMQMTAIIAQLQSITNNWILSIQMITDEVKTTITTV